MINPAILSQRINDKLSKTCLTAIVTETFMQALPFTAEDVSHDAKKYTSYVNTVMESLHCENMLKNAMKAHVNNREAMNLLTSIQEAIDSAVAPATHRVVTEASKNKATDINEVVDKTAFTDSEKHSLMNKAADINTKTVSEIIKKKVIDTIKDEKDAYDAAMKLKDDIKENLQDAFGEDEDSSLESYLDTVLSKGDPRDHISFFSRLQDTCMESLIQMETPESLMDEDNVSLECLVNTTINSTLNCFDKSVLNLDDSLNILSKAVESIDLVPDDKSKSTYANKSLIMSVVITTIMETLKTLNLWSPTIDDIRQFVDSPTAANTPAQNLANKIHDEVVDTKKAVSKNNVDKDNLTTALGCYNQIKSRVSGISEELLPNKKKILDEITEAINAIESSITQESTGVEDDGTSYYTRRAREMNVAEFDRVARIMFRNPNIKKAQIICESAAPIKKENKVIVRGLSDIGSITDQITACITMTPAFKDLVTELKTASKFSKLGDYAGQAEIYFPDKCRAVPLFDPEK